MGRLAELQGQPRRLDPSGAYDRHKASVNKRQLAASAAGRDIGDLPPVADPARRERCRNDLRLFFETYFPEKFRLGWSADHLVIISKIETAVRTGGLFALAMPRGSGKTTICERAALWATLYAHRRFVALIGATEDAARQLLNEIKTEIECNPLLGADFPEVCVPVRKLDGINLRAKGQTYRGERTRIVWTDAEAVFPTIAGSASSGTVIQVRGITGRVRGMKAATATGASLRPDYVLLDDPQTDESASSPEQNRKRLRILNGAILGMAGPGVKIAGVMPCTVIRQGDMADEILDRDKHPEWQGERRKLLQSFPTATDLWNRYNEIRQDSLRDLGDISAATEFYAEHRAEMDAGAVVGWPDRHQPTELSGIQSAMNLFFYDKDTFYSEYQNEPLPEEVGDAPLTCQDVWSRLNNRARGTVPLEAEHVVVFIDVQGKLLYWLAMAVADNYTSAVIDWGAWPDQHRRYFQLKDAQPTFNELFPTSGLEGAIYGALTALIDDLATRKFKRDDGAELYAEKIVIDSAWGNSTKTVYRVCRESQYSRILLPSKGRGITAAQKPMTEYRQEPGVKLGFNWRIFKVRGSATARILEYDTNFYKSFFRERLRTPMGDAGGLTVNGSDIEATRLLAEHLTSESATETAGNGRRVDIWKLIPGRENHWLDGAVGCLVAASVLGCDLAYTGPRLKRTTGTRPSAPAKTSTSRLTPGAPVQRGRTIAAGRVHALHGAGARLGDEY